MRSAILVDRQGLRRLAQPIKIHPFNIGFRPEPTASPIVTSRQQRLRRINGKKQLLPEKNDPVPAEPNQSAGEQEQNDKIPSQRVHHQVLETPQASMVGCANQWNPTSGHPTISNIQQIRGVAEVTSALPQSVLR